MRPLRNIGTESHAKQLRQRLIRLSVLICVGEVPVDAGAGDAEGFRDLGGAFTFDSAGAGGGDLVGVHDDGASTDPALRSGGRQASHGAFAEHVPLDYVDTWRMSSPGDDGAWSA